MTMDTHKISYHFFGRKTWSWWSFITKNMEVEQLAQLAMERSSLTSCVTWGYPNPIPIKFSPPSAKHGWLENPPWMEVWWGQSLINGSFSSQPRLITRGYTFSSDFLVETHLPNTIWQGLWMFLLVVSTHLSDCPSILSSNIGNDGGSPLGGSNLYHEQATSPDWHLQGGAPSDKLA